jgi:hypothetical protein
MNEEEVLDYMCKNAKWENIAAVAEGKDQNYPAFRPTIADKYLFLQIILERERQIVREYKLIPEETWEDCKRGAISLMASRLLEKFYYLNYSECDRRERENIRK